eukprot:scaffold1724_cov341-Pavlova_lutheri.AAC.16
MILLPVFRCRHVAAVANELPRRSPASSPDERDFSQSSRPPRRPSFFPLRASFNCLLVCLRAPSSGEEGVQFVRRSKLPPHPSNPTLHEGNLEALMKAASDGIDVGLLVQAPGSQPWFDAALETQAQRVHVEGGFEAQSTELPAQVGLAYDRRGSMHRVGIHAPRQSVVGTRATDAQYKFAAFEGRAGREVRLADLHGHLQPHGCPSFIVQAQRSIPAEVLEHHPDASRRESSRNADRETPRLVSVPSLQGKHAPLKKGGIECTFARVLPQREYPHVPSKKRGTYGPKNPRWTVDLGRGYGSRERNDPPKKGV